MCIGLHVQYRYSFSILMKLEFSRQIFQNDSNINSHEDSSSRSHGVPCVGEGQTDNGDEANSRSLQFCESV
jgi:hypothetical protein